MNDPIEKLAALFAQFPGIGERQSKRFVYHLLTKPENYLSALTEGIKNLRQTITECADCHRLFPQDQAKRTPDGRTVCDYCSKMSFDTVFGSLIIVEKDADYDAVRRSGTYKGHYFILGGLVPIATKSAIANIRTGLLLSRISDLSKNNNLKEIILAFSLNPQGEHTDSYIRSLLEPLSESSSLRVTSLGRGLSTGTEVEYSDSDTLRYALKNRS